MTDKTFAHFVASIDAENLSCMVAAENLKGRRVGSRNPPSATMRKDKKGKSYTANPIFNPECSGQSRELFRPHSCSHVEP